MHEIAKLFSPRPKSKIFHNFTPLHALVDQVALFSLLNRDCEEIHNHNSIEIFQGWPLSGWNLQMLPVEVP